MEILKEMLDDVPEFSDEEVLINLVKQGSFEAISKYLLRKSLSFEVIQEFKISDIEKFLEKTIVALSKKDLELTQKGQFKDLSDGEKKEILKDLIQFSKKEKDEILEILRQIREGD